MNVEDIRKCFSKGSVALGGKNIFVFYSFHERWVTQSICDDNKKLFIELLNNSNSFTIDRVPQKYIKLSFLSNAFGELETGFYNPVECEVTLKELEEKMVVDFQKSREHDDFFASVDLSDDEKVLDRMAEWVSIINERNRGNLKSFTPPGMWAGLRFSAERLARTLGCYILSDDPDDYSNGSFEFSFDEDSKKTVSLSGKGLDELTRLAEVAESITIECLVDKGYLNLSLLI